MVEFSLVVPCYNDAGRLQRGVERLIEVMSPTGLPWEFVFVEDHSRDETAAAVRQCVERLHSRGVVASVIYLDHNHGHGGCLSSGIRAARGDIVGYVELDVSLAEGLVPMIELVHRGEADLVVGRRLFGNPAADPIALVAHWIYRQYASACLRLPVADPECRLKVFRRARILSFLDAVEDQHCFWDTELLDRGLRAGLTITEWPIRVSGEHLPKGVPRLRSARAYVRAMKNYRAGLPVVGRSTP